MLKQFFHSVFTSEINILVLVVEELTISGTASLIALWNSAVNGSQFYRIAKYHNLPCPASLPIAFAPAYRTVSSLSFRNLTISGITSSIAS